MPASTPTIACDRSAGTVPPMDLSVIIRARDEADAIGEVLDLLAAQSVAHEVVVVDSGSRDATVSIARDRGASVIELAPSAFSFGHALNVGAAAASGEVVVALSAHAFPRSTGWLERMLGHFEDPRVACAFGERVDERFVELRAPVRQDFARLSASPFWGYSNSAGGFRAALWSRRGFREDMPGSEDREWSWWALREGFECVLDPALVVDHDHSRDSLRSGFDRYAREARGFAMFLDLPPYGLRALLGEWWSDQGGHRSRARARLDPRRAGRLAGKWWGRRPA